MSGLGKLVANLFSATNENTLALASLKFDFSLMKVDAPVEFSGLGQALSLRRRRDAEDGNPHQTARRLAALFEQLVPSTPKLITAYGLRSTEIIEKPGINPKSSSMDGPFETFIGADGTAIWAAATSGIPALGVYLLACLLARAWDAKEAISIWVELVETRRKEIEDGFRNHHAVSEASRMSIHQDISREDLARWDASARAWLRSADQAKMREQTQLTLIIKNSQLPFNGGSSTYHKVIEAWQQGMKHLESLLNGRPQAISNRSVLLAFSAWHLYPNLIWLGSDIKNVEFNDPLVDSGGIGTIALEPRSTTAAQSTGWSLTLSHLRYYGKPVTVESNTDFSRVSIQQLHVVALGAIFRLWNVNQREVPASLDWFSRLRTFLHQNATDGALDGLDWFKYLAEAAGYVQHSANRHERIGFQLLSYGQRRGERFLGEQHHVMNPENEREPITPFFGLAYESTLDGLSEKLDEERAVAYLRAVAKENGWRSTEAFIGRTWQISATCNINEYMTAVPHHRRIQKLSSDGALTTEASHARWFHFEEPATLVGVTSAQLKSALSGGFKFCHKRNEIAVDINEVPSEVNKASFKAPFDVDKGPFELHHGHVVWKNPPLLFLHQESPPKALEDKLEVDSYMCHSQLFGWMSCRCFEPTGDVTNVAYFETIRQLHNYTLYVRSKPAPFASDTRKPDSLDPTASIVRLTSSPMSADVISAYLQHFVTPRNSTLTGQDGHYISCKDTIDDNTDSIQWSTLEYFQDRSAYQTSKMMCCNFSYVWGIADVSPVKSSHLWALTALTLATEVYQQLEGSTISLSIVDNPLNEASWLPEGMQALTEKTIGDVRFPPTILPATLGRLNALSCIAQFESGTLDLPPEEYEQTLAIASGNSIFVVGALISDPIDTKSRNKVKRIVGNIGRTGICLLIAPVDPQIRSLGHEYNLVNYASYDGKRENNFAGTSLHLSFTDWVLPVEVEGLKARTIDQEAYFVESVISVLDSGKWVADLDILGVDFKIISQNQLSSECLRHSGRLSDVEITSIDSWEELLDESTKVGIFRAYGNWAARLAAVSILCQKNKTELIRLSGSKYFCLECLAKDGTRNNKALVCID